MQGWSVTHQRLPKQGPVWKRAGTARAPPSVPLLLELKPCLPGQPLCCACSP